jgi:hypothetical protein
LQALASARPGFGYGINHNKNEPAEQTCAGHRHRRLCRVVAGRSRLQDRLPILDHRALSAKQFLIFLIYLVPFTAFFVVALHVLHRNFSTMGAARSI